MNSDELFTKGPWRFAVHAPFLSSDFKIAKVENPEQVIFDGFGNRMNDAILASKSLDMLKALNTIADPWSIAEIIKAQKGTLEDGDTAITMANIAKKIIQEIENEISNSPKP